jgi:hypothetical protein
MHKIIRSDELSPSPEHGDHLSWVSAAGGVQHRPVKRLASAIVEGSIAGTQVGQYLRELAPQRIAR